MKALVKESAGPGFVLRDVPEPRIRDDEVLIRVRRAGVCGTDVHIYEWDDWAKSRCKPPFVVGHEFAGDVVEVGRLVTDVQEGDRVTAEGHIVDGRCLLCRTGNAHVCPYTKIIGVDRDGCFAEYIAMPATNVWHLDDAISYDVGGIHDPMGNAFHTALTADIPGATVLVTGCGPIGLMSIGVLKMAGARAVYATDIVEERIEMARKMGADLALDARGDVVERLKAETDGNGVDIVLEMSGSAAALHQGLAAITNGGRVSLLGTHATPATLDLSQEVIFKGIRVYGITGRKLWDTWYRTTALLEEGLDISSIITHRLPLGEYAKAFDLVASGHAGKIVLLPQEG